MNLVDFAREIEQKQRTSRAEKHARPWKPTATPASAIGSKCDRKLVYMRVSPDLAAPPSEELSSIFEEGNLHDRDIRRELTELGYEVLDNQAEFSDERLELKGHVDGRLWFNGRRIPYEAKSTVGDGPASQADWREAEGLLGRYYDQLTLYLFLTSTPHGLGLFKNKATGQWRVVAIDLDYERAERLLQRAERVRDAVRLKVLPDRLLDRSECAGCQFNLTCLPGDAPVDPLLIAEDETLLDDLRKREAWRGDHEAFERLDKKTKERFKLTNGSRFVVGEFLVTKKVAKNGAVTVKTDVLTDKPEPPKVQDLIDDLKRSLERDKGAQQGGA